MPCRGMLSPGTGVTNDGINTQADCGLILLSPTKAGIDPDLILLILDKPRSRSRSQGNASHANPEWLY